MMTGVLTRPAPAAVPAGPEALEICRSDADHDWTTDRRGNTWCRRCHMRATGGYRAAALALAALVVPVLGGGDHSRCPVCNGTGTRKQPTPGGGTVEVPCDR